MSRRNSHPSPARPRTQTAATEPLEPRRLMSAAVGRVIFQDDFNGTALDAGRWRLPDPGPSSFIDRTQFRVAGQAAPVVANGVARLRLDTHNPTANTPGDSFYGEEIISRSKFARPAAGLVIEARARVVGPTTGGIVDSLFTYDYPTAPNARDEIDVELLTNRVADGSHDVLTNVFNDDGFGSAGAVRRVDVPGLNLTAFNTYRVCWLPNRVEWYVNGRLVRSESQEVANDPMTVRLNTWAPGPNFAGAYNADLQPSATAAGNRSFYYDVDYVKVSEAAPADGAGNTLRTARAVGALSGTRTFADAVTPADTNDFYRFTVSGNRTVTARLTGLSANANLQLIRDVDGDGVIDSGDVLRASANAGTASEVVTRAVTAGTYYVRVYPAAGATTRYTLTLSA